MQRLGQSRHSADALCQLLLRCDRGLDYCAAALASVSGRAADASASAAVGPPPVAARGSGEGAEESASAAGAEGRADTGPEGQSAERAAAGQPSPEAQAAAEEAVQWRRRKEMARHERTPSLNISFSPSLFGRGNPVALVVPSLMADLPHRSAPHPPLTQCSLPLTIARVGISQVLFSLVSHHCHLRNPLAALQWLNLVAAERPSAVVFCTAAHLLLQIGDVDGAGKAADMAEEAANARAGGAAADELAAVERTQALLLLAKKNFLVRFQRKQHLERRSGRVA